MNRDSVEAAPRAGAIRRAPAELAGEGFDLAVVGGGIQGVMFALEGARRGLSTLLLERDDFGGATSWSSLRILHGGLRYLQTADLPRFRESVRERSWFLRNFPDLVSPLPCLMPIRDDGGAARSGPVLRAALALNDLLSADRNRGVANPLPPGQVLDAAATRRLAPVLEPRGLRGGALWYDARMDRPERLLLELLRWATAAGARALNYVEVVGAVESGRRVQAVRAVDTSSGEVLEFRCRAVVNCAGPWGAEVGRALLTPLFPPLPLALAFNVVLDASVDRGLALAVGAPPGRRFSLFLHGHEQGLLAGTGHAAARGGNLAPSEEQVGAMVRSLGAALPSLELSPDSVRRVLSGLQPAPAPGAARAAGRSPIVDHARIGGPGGIHTVVAHKYTTARATAARLLDRIFPDTRAAAGRALPPRQPDPTPTSRRELEALHRADPESARRALRSVLSEEAVMSMEDLVLRRLGWGLDPAEGKRAAALARRVLGPLAPAAATAAEIPLSP